jgi:spoIIIJ-associated protein
MAKKAKTTEVSESAHVEEITHALFDRLGISGDIKVAVSEDMVEIALDTEDSGIVIGYHGEVLEALQLVLSMMIAKKIGRFVRVSLEVGDYRKNRTEFLQTLVMQTKEKVLAESKEFSLPNLKSWERRIVHTLLQEDTEVVSESVGEGKERTLIIKPR